MTPLTLEEAMDDFNLATAWAPAAIDQELPEPSADGACCVGARLGMHLNVGYDHPYGLPYYLLGADAWARSMGATRAHAILLLRQAGAGFNPFSALPWETAVEEVAMTLRTIEELPSLVGANLRRADLRGADLSGWDLHGADLSGANLERANLSETNLSEACLFYANLLHAVLKDTHLEGADLRYAQAKWSSFGQAHTRGAQMPPGAP